VSDEKDVQSLADLPELETVCEECEGAGRLYTEGRWIRCALCHGSGCELTDFGQKVLDLMRHNFRSIQEDLESC
jgi:hypothetical protein